MKHKHQWKEILVEGINAMGNLALWKVYKCKKCGFETKGVYLDTIKECRESIKISKSIGGNFVKEETRIREEKEGYKKW